MLMIQDSIRTKRDGHTLSVETIQHYIKGVTDNTISDAQIAAMCMAIVWRGLNHAETAYLTCAMRDSGTVLAWPDLDGPVIDKHSTGGVGDKISLMLAPMAAACGLYVPMIVGRGLGHTGGTRDKLDAIAGFNSALDSTRFQNTVRTLGCAIIGQTADIAPADGRIYAVRDVTATVESISLITASILSKKMAAGLQGLVMDIKCGNGAFMDNVSDAHKLAQSLRDVAAAAGLAVTPVITDMNQLLGQSAGNAVEVFEAIDYLTGTYREPRLHTLTLHLVAQMLMLGHKARDLNHGVALAQDALDSGRAAEIFARMIAAQGGPADILDHPARSIPKAPVVIDVFAPHPGYLSACDTRALGMVLVNLHAGRARVEDVIDPRIGITDMLPLGTYVDHATPLCRLHLADNHHAAAACAMVVNCCRFSETPPSSLRSVLLDD